MWCLVHRLSVWAGNLFTGWSVFLAVLGSLFFVLAFAVPKETAKEYTPAGKIMKVAARLSAVYELLVVVAMGWWVTAVFYSWGWGCKWIAVKLLEPYTEANGAF